MPNELYLVRLIHNLTGRPFPGERLWTAAQLVSAATIRFLRARNWEGCDVYVHPYAGNQSAGYILVDLDRAGPTAVNRMRANGHDPCVVVQTSPGHLQAWIRLSSSPLEPTVATAAGRHLAHLYGGDGASTDWRHLGRLAGFTNQKPARRTPDRYAPWVRLVHARAGLAPSGASLLAVRQAIYATASRAVGDRLDRHRPWPSQRRGGRHALPKLPAAAMAYSGTLSAAGLEHRRSLGGQTPALAGQAGCSDSSHPSPRQSAFSSPPRRSR